MNITFITYVAPAIIKSIVLDFVNQDTIARNNIIEIMIIIIRVEMLSILAQAMIGISSRIIVRKITKIFPRCLIMEPE